MYTFESLVQVKGGRDHSQNSQIWLYLYAALTVCVCWSDGCSVDGFCSVKKLLMEKLKMRNGSRYLLAHL